MKILAFPGMGKTTLAKISGRYYDLDFDYLREQNHLSKWEVEPLLLRRYVYMADLLEENGFIVLLSEPAVLGFNCAVSSMILPKGKAIHRCAKKLSVSDRQVEDWVLDWMAYADRNNLAVLRTDRFLATEILPFETEPVAPAHKKRAFRK